MAADGRWPAPATAGHTAWGGIGFGQRVVRRAVGAGGAAVAIATGWQCRVAPALPMKLVVVDDRAALLPPGPTGMEGAVLVRAPVVVAALRDYVAALRDYFELVGTAAQPVDPTVDDLPAELRELLALVMTGMTDTAIARHLSISERTVRRHVGTLMRHFAPPTGSRSRWP